METFIVTKVSMCFSVSFLMNGLFKKKDLSGV